MQLRELDKDFSVSDQLVPRDLASLRAAGFRTVLCARQDGEEEAQPPAAEMEKAAHQLGLDFLYAPFAPEAVTDDQALELARVIHSSAGPVVGYCKNGSRAEALWRRAAEAARQPMPS